MDLREAALRDFMEQAACAVLHARGIPEPTEEEIWDLIQEEPRPADLNDYLQRNWLQPEEMVARFLEVHGENWQGS